MPLALRAGPRLHHALFAASLVLNAVALAAWWRTTRLAPDAPPATADAGSAGALSPGAGPVKDAAETGAITITPARDADDMPRVLRDVLRAAGFAEADVRGAVYQIYTARLFRETVKPLPWWQNSPSSSFRTLPAEAQARLKTVMTELFGDDRHPWANMTAQTKGLEFLSSEKRAAVERVTGDYAEMSSAIYTEMSDFQMPDDQKRLEFLKAELNRDLAGILTPEELNELNLLESSAGRRAQFVANAFDMDEAEYRAVVGLRREAEARMAALANPTPAQTRENEAWFEQQLEQLVGPERYRRAGILRSSDVKTLVKARARLGFSQETFDAVLSQRDRASEAVARIVAGSESKKEKQAALRTQADAIRAEVRRLLGDDASEAYFTFGMTWLHDLERGIPVRFRSDGETETEPLR